ncbi:short-chain dehydrogenase TIC 32, chloroplastic [Ricinus communis]|uniref:Short-chain dehydrogenase, putative n=1 Tax=Ricinus communis TaxID=3988 RepID=B9RCD3_RICCO|nr:short-chain dehydrogenase TIC 32, chloroplastic [Ricinus communis]EEF51204.1 short-chain dehydrogenase, putative [Ricinus communis]|eukprot:XP_002509817.1 short-chain dehydrogenase TIC 32, chloroplastic [Ricinus communis]
MSKFGWKGPSGFSASSTAEEVTQGIDGSSLTAIITGASSGIGAETARVLALRGVHVIMAVRNVKAGTTVKEEILENIPTAKIDVMELDLSVISSVRNFASEYISLGLPLNILINNAGISTSKQMLSKDNIEINFAINHLGHFLLTNLLLETMKNTAGGSNIQGRIIIVSSLGHLFARDIPFDELNKISSHNSSMGYPRSKLANVLHANELAKRFKEEGVDITANSLHPGLIFTNILRHNAFHRVIFGLANKFLLKNVQQGAATSCYVALNPQVKGVNGQYFVDCNIGKPNSLVEDEELAKKLWDYSLSLINKN